jgi:Ca2+-binding RTX toxin-like protein
MNVPGGNDVPDGGWGDDGLAGENGNDTLKAGAGNDCHRSDGPNRPR